MAQTKKVSSSEQGKRHRPALTPESREQQMIALAIDLAEEQLRNGTASSQIISHYLKLGSTNNQLELEKMKKENELLAAKTEALKSAKRSEELFAEAISAMKSYQGVKLDETDED